MVYRFKLVSDEVSNFAREIEIDSENTFLQLRNTILDSVNYSKDELDSFFLCDEDWQRQEEITLEDMGTASDQDVWLMENTTLSELFEDEGQKMVFVFDYLTERSFFMELKEMIPSRTLTEPICTFKKGNAPQQSIDLDEFDKKIDLSAQEKIDAIDDMDVFSSDEFNDEDIENGFDIMNMD